MTNLPGELRPIIQPIDDWNNARKLGLLFEARVEQGRLMVCSIDILNDLETRPVARQLRQSLLTYLSSEKFNPAIRLSVDELHNLFR